MSFNVNNTLVIRIDMPTDNKKYHLDLYLTSNILDIIELCNVYNCEATVYYGLKMITVNKYTNIDLINL